MSAVASGWRGQNGHDHRRVLGLCNRRRGADNLVADHHDVESCTGQLPFHLLRHLPAAELAGSVALGVQIGHQAQVGGNRRADTGSVARPELPGIQTAEELVGGPNQPLGWQPGDDVLHQSKFAAEILGQANLGQQLVHTGALRCVERGALAQQHGDTCQVRLAERAPEGDIPTPHPEGGNVADEEDVVGRILPEKGKELRTVRLAELTDLVVGQVRYPFSSACAAA